MSTSPANSSNNILTILAIIIGLGVMVGFINLFSDVLERTPVTKNVPSQPFRSDEPEPQVPDVGNNDALLTATANQVNASCPFMIDRETRLDNAMSMGGNIFQYNYTLVNTDASMVDMTGWEAAIRPNMINMLRTSPDMQVFRDLGTTLEYNYKDKYGNFLIKLTFTAADYSGY
jgi:hypothetical protein